MLKSFSCFYNLYLENICSYNYKRQGKRKHKYLKHLKFVRIT